MILLTKYQTGLAVLTKSLPAILELIRYLIHNIFRYRASKSPYSYYKLLTIHIYTIGFQNHNKPDLELNPLK